MCMIKHEERGKERKEEERKEQFGKHHQKKFFSCPPFFCKIFVVSAFFFVAEAWHQIILKVPNVVTKNSRKPRIVLHSSLLVSTFGLLIQANCTANEEEKKREGRNEKGKKLAHSLLEDKKRPWK